MYVNEGTCHYVSVEAGGPSCVLVLILCLVWERCPAVDCLAYQTSWPVSFWIPLSLPKLLLTGALGVPACSMAFLWVLGLWSHSSHLGSTVPTEMPHQPISSFAYVIPSQKCLFSYFHFISSFEQYSAFLLLPGTKNLLHGLLDTKRVIYLTVPLFFTFTIFYQAGRFLIWYYRLPVSKFADRSKNVLTSGYLNF